VTQRDDDPNDPANDPVSTVVMSFDALSALSATKGGAIVDIERGAVLGTGGTAIVFRGRDPALQRDVALKVLATAGDPHAEDTFVEEARITAELEHPFIPAVYRLGVDGNGAPCLVMELIRGRTFAAAMSDATLSQSARLRRAVDVLIKVCDALAHAHAKHIVHCDLTPNNLMVGDHGEVVLMDWGLARRLDRPALGAKRATTSGTPAYMAPEQALMPESIDARVDVWGVGALLYHALTLRPPRPELPRWATASEQSERFLSDVAHPDRVDASLPRTLCASCTRALSRDPAARHASIRALRDELAAWAEGGHLFDTRLVAAGDDVVRQGDVGADAFAIVRGRCEARQRREDGSERVLRVLGPGDVFGEVAALGGGTRTATVTALEECELLVVGADDLLPDVVPAHAGALRSFVAALVARLRDAEQRATHAEGELSRLRASAQTLSDD
jgi:hypothetical protein